MTTSQKGVTLVELLVVLAIIGVLVGLLLPAVQYAREAARRTSCSNNLKQIGIGILHHESTHQFFPTGGWGADWVGDPDAGFTEKQPGGWIFNILPYIEANNVREIGSRLAPEEKRASRSLLLESPLAVFHCPSRRGAKLFPYTGPPKLQNADPPKKVAKTDYAINGEISPLREAVSEGDLDRSLGTIVLAGEKSIASGNYLNGKATGDQLTMYVGDSADVRRSTSEFSSDREGGNGFGGTHPTGCNFVYGDGSVRFIAYDSDIYDQQ